MSIPISSNTFIEKAVISPNPNNGSFLFSLKTGIEAYQRINISLLNIFGMPIKTILAVNNKGVILLQVQDLDLPNGVYFVRYAIGEMSNAVKMIVQH